MAITTPRRDRSTFMQLRSLELQIRSAVSEERRLERRLADAADTQRRTRSAIESELRRQHYGRLPENWNGRQGPSNSVPGGG